MLSKKHKNSILFFIIFVFSVSISLWIGKDRLKNINTHVTPLLASNQPLNDRSDNTKPVISTSSGKTKFVEAQPGIPALSEIKSVEIKPTAQNLEKPPASNTTSTINLEIISPVYGQVFPVGTPVIHKATALNADKVDISKKIEWRDSSNTLLNRGASLNMVRPAGTYTVSALMVDERGHKTTKSVYYVVSTTASAVDIKNSILKNADLTSDPPLLQTATSASPSTFSSQSQASSKNYVDNVYYGVNKNIISSPDNNISKNVNFIGFEQAAAPRETTEKTDVVNQSTTKRLPKPPAVLNFAHKVPDGKLFSEIDLKRYVSVVDSNINWDSLEFQSQNFNGVSIQKSTDPSVLEVDYSNDFGGTDEICYRVRNTEGMPSEWATVSITSGTKPPIELEGFEVPELPVDNSSQTGTSGSTDSLIESKWNFAGGSIQRNGGRNFGYAWNAPTAPEGLQTAVLMGDKVRISKEVYLRQGRYKVSFYAARRGFCGETPNPIQVRLGDSNVGEPISPLDTIFRKYNTNEFFIPRDGKYNLELRSTSDACKWGATTFLDKVSINYVNSEL
jgi:hypothetical protein